MFYKTKRESGKVDTLIGCKALFEGNLLVEEGLRIDGTIRGKVECKGHLIIGEYGQVEGDIVAETIVIDGEVNGNIIARDKLEITCKGRVHGDIETSRLVMIEGVTFEGFSRMSSKKVVPVLQTDKGEFSQVCEG
ncbi:MAG: polymer-forming cytoskeletal protein [Thermodesulfobacteriota bacterium]|nr:polymer-forming cytoskeletal protein [Thermodesulfobacteriota bacterium]